MNKFYKLYTDDTDSAESLNSGFEILDIELYDDNTNSLFIIFNKKFKIDKFIDKGFIITLFPSEFSDFEITETNTEAIRKKLNFFISLIDNSELLPFKESESADFENLSYENEKTEMENKVIIKESSVFKGIYVNGVLIRRGNIRFIPLYEVILNIFKNSFTGNLSITQKGANIYSLEFYGGKLSYIESFTESDNFQYFLKQYGYISEINRDIYLYPAEQQLGIFITKNRVFKHEKSIILKDYYTFLFRNAISLKSGDFDIYDDCKHTAGIFNEYLNFLYNFVNYIKVRSGLPEYLSVSDDIALTFSHLSEEAGNILTEVKNGRSITEIQTFFSNKYDKNYIINVLYFFKILGIIEEDRGGDNIIVSSANVNENISQRIKIWLDKIKKENYFTLLGININDNEEYIEEKFRNLFSQFSTYLSSEELRVKYKNDLEDIIFELESAYSVIKDRELRNKYYKKMLK